MPIYENGIQIDDEQFVKADNALAPMQGPSTLPNDQLTRQVGQMRQAAAAPAAGVQDANRQLAAMVYGDKQAMRSMSKSERVAFLGKQYLKAEAFGEQDKNPANRLSLRVPGGATFDQSIGDDYDEMSPEMKAVYSDATKRFSQQFSRAMSGTDTTKFSGIDDVEELVNNLPIMRTHGALIEGFARDAMTKFMPPELKGMLKANDLTHAEFAKWYDDNGLGINGQTVEQAWDEMHGTGPFAGQPMSQAARLMRKNFESDPNTRKFEFDNATGRVRERQLTPQQRMDIQLEQQQRVGKFQQGMEKSQIDAKVLANRQLLNSMPPEQRRQFIDVDPNTGELIKSEKPEKQQGYATAAEAKAAAEMASRETGQKYAPVFKGGRWDTDIVKEEGETFRQSRDAQAEAEAVAGLPVFKVGKNVVVSTDSTYLRYVDAWTTGKDGAKRPIYTTAALKNAMDLGDNVQYAPKKGMEQYLYRPGGEPSLPKPDKPDAVITPELAREFLGAAGGDKDKARKLAAEAGWKF